MVLQLCSTVESLEEIFKILTLSLQPKRWVHSIVLPNSQVFSPLCLPPNGNIAGIFPGLFAAFAVIHLSPCQWTRSGSVCHLWVSPVNLLRGAPPYSFSSLLLGMVTTRTTFTLENNRWVPEGSWRGMGEIGEREKQNKTKKKSHPPI